MSKQNKVPIFFSTKWLKDWRHQSCIEILEGLAGALLILASSKCNTNINFRIS
jgi:hypothetical protein